MKKYVLTVCALICGVSSFAQNVPDSYEQAKTIWEKTKDSSEFSAYMEDFLQYNNYYRLDEINNCYKLSKGPVDLILVITHKSVQKYAQIQYTFTDVNNTKAQCFKQTYTGLNIKVPPYSPFVIKLKMQ